MLKEMKVSAVLEERTSDFRNETGHTQAMPQSHADALQYDDTTLDSRSPLVG